MGRWVRSGHIAGALAGVLAMAILVAIALAALVFFADPVPCHCPVFEMTA